MLRRMEQLLGERQLDATLLWELFVQRLPAPVRLVLSSTPASLDLSGLATIADKVVESTAPTVSTVSTVATFSASTTACASARPACSDDLSELRIQVSPTRGYSAGSHRFTTSPRTGTVTRAQQG
eukprot:scpid92477/ scgid21718/ 